MIFHIYLFLSRPTKEKTTQYKLYLSKYCKLFTIGCNKETLFLPKTVKNRRKKKNAVKTFIL